MEKMEVKWEIQQGDIDHQHALNKYTRYLQDKGIRNSTIASYVIRVSKFLEFVQNDNPSIVDSNWSEIIFWTRIFLTVLSTIALSL